MKVHGIPSNHRFGFMFSNETFMGLGDWKNISLVSMGIEITILILFFMIQLRSLVNGLT